ncbi:MAG: type II toxin-antitoxin system RelE/ParE family toxin [Planctomycetota bacterium]
MKYAIDVLRSAQKRLAKLSPQDQDRIVAAIAGLSEAPRPAGSQKLTGRDAMRIRVGDYRVIYEINDASRALLIVVIAHRKDAYR